MTKRYIPILALVACLSVAGGPAFATDDPPQAPPATDTTPAPGTPAAPAPGQAAPGQTAPVSCVDTTRPRTRVLTSSRTAARSHTLRGTATDAGATGAGCRTAGSVALVSVSIALKHGTHCKYLTRKARLSRSGTCKSPRWLSATGTKRWVLRLPRRIPHGKYQILTRAVDSAGNVERAHARRLAIRQPRSTNKTK